MDQFASFVGMDLGDTTAHLCVMAQSGGVLEEGRISLTAEALKHRFASMPVSLVVMEVGTHSRWVSREIEQLGHEVIIADARQLKLISSSCTKSDRSDAEHLARMGRAGDLELIKPVVHRSEATHAALAVVRSRALVVETRTKLVNSVRGQLKPLGHRLPPCQTSRFHTLLDQIPHELRGAIEPLMHAIANLNAIIKAYDAEVDRLGREEFPKVQLLRTVPGVGPLVALTFVLTIERPKRFTNNRAVAAYLGLVPRRFQSGDRDPQLRITKTGDRYMRKLLVQSAHWVLGRFGSDSELRRWGLKLAGDGRVTKRKAVVAVARKLSVLLLTLWKSNEVFDPFHHRGPDSEAVHRAGDPLETPSAGHQHQGQASSARPLRGPLTQVTTSLA